MVCASMAFAQAGGIGIYVDTPAYTSCSFTDAAAALVPTYVVHKLCPGATASQFMVVPGGGWNCTFTGEIIAVPTSIGSSLAGLSAAYGGCLASDILISTINWFCAGTSPACAYLEVVPDPAAPTGTIEVVDCAFIKHVGVGSMLFVNPGAGCGRACGLPTSETSWGQIKSIYGQ
jgi:hypothetical protein